MTYNKITPSKQTKKYTNSTEKQNNNYSKQCFSCQKTFNRLQVSLYEHQNCPKLFCYPCLYQLYNIQVKKLPGQINQHSEQQPIQFNCCKNKHLTLQTYKWMFILDVCIICGLDSQKDNFMFKFQDRFQICRKCMKSGIQKIQGSQSLQNVRKEILDNMPYECVFCEKSISIQKCQKQQLIQAVNRKLCYQCFKNHGKKYPDNILLLKSRIGIQNVSEICNNNQNLNQISCCEINCSRTVFTQEKTEFHMKKTYIIQDLVYWRNNKIYCGVCLYFKYESKRKTILEKQNITETQINQFGAQTVCFQNYFQNKCMICLTPPQSQNRHRLLPNQKIEQLKNYNNTLKLSCQYCQRCFTQLYYEYCQGKQNFSKILNQFSQRDQGLKNTFEEIKSNEKQFLLKKCGLIGRSEFKSFWNIKQINIFDNEEQQRGQQEKSSEFKQFKKVKSQENHNKGKQKPNKMEQPDIGEAFKRADQNQNIMKTGSKGRRKEQSKFIQQNGQRFNEGISLLQLQEDQGEMRRKLQERLKVKIMTVEELQAQLNSSSDTQGKIDQANRSFNQKEYLGKIYTQIIGLIQQKQLEKIEREQEERMERGGQNLQQIKCRVKSCKLYQDNSKIQRVRGNERMRSRIFDQEKEETIVFGDAGLLKMGMMCEVCFTKYLLGMIDLNQQVQRDIYEKEHQKASQLTSSFDQKQLKWKKEYKQM